MNLTKYKLIKHKLTKYKLTMGYHSMEEFEEFYNYKLTERDNQVFKYINYIIYSFIGFNLLLLLFNLI